MKKFYIVDAFTQEIFGGNPAGVVLLSPGEDFPSDETMRKTAAELRYSETAFIRPKSDSEFQIRYFTPAAEVELCGHATIGSFCALMEEGLVKKGCTYVDDTLAGRLEIQVEEGFVLMEMGQAKELKEISDSKALNELYRIMGLSEDVRPDGCYPALVSTGLPDIMLPVRDEKVLAAISPDFPALSRLSQEYEVTGVHAFVLPEFGERKAVVSSLEKSDCQLKGSDCQLDQSDCREPIHCRNFAPLYEIDEEAATGTANGALTYYLYRRGLVKPGQETCIVQGETMDRPSLIRTRLTKEGEKIKIQVGGSAAILASGVIKL